MATRKMLALFAALAFIGTALPACASEHDKGPLEKAGRDVDQAANETGKKIDHAADSAGKTLDKAGKDAGNAFEGFGRGIGEFFDKLFD